MREGERKGREEEVLAVASYWFLEKRGGSQEYVLCEGCRRDSERQVLC